MDSINRLLSHLTIHISGGITHSQPLELFYPQQRCYKTFSPMFSEPAAERSTIVQHRDIMSLWRLPNVVAAYEVYFWQMAFEAALARETMSIAAETFAGEHKTAAMDTITLLRRFGEYLESLDTQPVTIPVSSLVDDMVESFLLACSEAPEFRTFAWATDLRATLEGFIRTRECFFYTDGRQPFVQVAFSQPSHQRANEMIVDIHYTTNLPEVTFERLHTIFDENRTFRLKPTISRPCQGLDVTFSTDQHVPFMTWNASEGLFDGYCPPFLAAIAGAERLDAFTMPLNMSAQITATLPGNMMFERTIRLAIPVTIRRKPETCSSDRELEESPAVRRPAFSVRIPSTDTTPQSTSTEKCQATTFSEAEVLSPNYKEVSGLLHRKARAMAARINSPLRLNSLSLAQLWEATAPMPLATDVQCWALNVDSPSNTAGPTPSPRQPLRIVSGNLKRDAATQDENDKGAPGPSKKVSNPPAQVRGDSPLGFSHSSHCSDLGRWRGPTRQESEEPLRAIQPCQAAAEASLPDWLIGTFQQTSEVAWRSTQSHQAAATAADAVPPSPDRLRDWRKAPERLSETEKDELQRAIQEAHRKDLEEEERDEEEDDSLLVEGDDDSAFSDL